MEEMATKPTNKYIFSIRRIGVRPAEYEDNHGFNYMVRGQKTVDEVQETLWQKEFDIKEERVVDLLITLLK